MRDRLGRRERVDAVAAELAELELELERLSLQRQPFSLRLGELLLQEERRRRRQRRRLVGCWRLGGGGGQRWRWAVGGLFAPPWESR